MGRRLGGLILALALAGLGMAAQPAPPKSTAVTEPIAVVSHAAVGGHASGPCALLNALKFGGEAERASAARVPGENDSARVRALIAAYGERPSERYPDRKRFEAARGCDDRELLEMALDACRSLNLTPLKSAWLDRGSSENSADQLRRIHALLRRSLDDGFPPIVRLGSNATARKDDNWAWKRIAEHYVCIVSVAEKLEPADAGFDVRFADSLTGKVREAYLYAEQFRGGYSGLKGSDRDPVSVGRPYLLAVTPGLPLGARETPWFARTTVTLECGIFRGPDKPASAPPAANAQPDPAAPKVVTHDGLRNSCGPLSLMNALKFGGAAERAAAAKVPGATDSARVRTLIAAYGSKPSVYPDMKRFDESHGCYAPDLKDMANDACQALGLKPVIGQRFRPLENESPTDQVRRLHEGLKRSLDAGFPPLISLYSFAAASDPSKPDGWAWKYAVGHVVCVVGLPEKLDPEALGFTFRFADSYNGKVTTGFFYVEQDRSLVAGPRGAPRPFLAAEIPAGAWTVLNTPRLWFLRTALGVDYGILRAPDPAGAAGGAPVR